jgi:hypothetical protein
MSHTQLLHRASSEANSRSASQEIPRLSWNLKVHYRVQNTYPTLSQMNPIPIIQVLSESQFLKLFIPKIRVSRAMIYQGVFKSFRTGRLERELQMVQLSALSAVV